MSIDFFPISYSNEDFSNLSNFKLFSQKVRPILNENYPQISTKKIMTLTAAHWHEFLDSKSCLSNESKQTQQESEKMDLETTSGSAKNRSRTRRRRLNSDENDGDENNVRDDSEENSSVSKKTNGSKRVPSLKIKLQNEIANLETNEDDGKRTKRRAVPGQLCPAADRRKMEAADSVGAQLQRGFKIQ